MGGQGKLSVGPQIEANAEILDGEPAFRKESRYTGNMDKLRVTAGCDKNILAK